MDAPERRRSSGKGKEREHSSSKGRSSRAKDYAGISAKNLARLLEFQERDGRALESRLAEISGSVQREADRANDAERRARDAALRFRSIDDARRLAEQDTLRAREELRLYHVQLHHAQDEINRAQEYLDALEKQRSEAENDAANARSKIRRLQMEKLLDHAREEGRRQGMQEGLDRGRDAGYSYALSQNALSRMGSEMAPGDDVNTMDDGPPIRAFRTPTNPSTETQTPVDPPAQRTQYAPSAGPSMQYAPAPEPQYDPPPDPTPQYDPAPERAYPVDDGQIHPIIVHNILRSPAQHAASTIPPEGWIPSMDDEGRMQLPPPHEMSRIVPPSPSMTELSATPLFTNNASLAPEDIGPVRIIPPPQPPQQTRVPSRPPSVAMPVPSVPHPITIPRTRPRRGSSPESGTSLSTTMSKMDLVAQAPPPEPAEPGSAPAFAGIGVGLGGGRDSRLRDRGVPRMSVIPEASPAATLTSMRRPSLQSVAMSPAPVAVPSRMGSVSERGGGRPPSAASSRAPVYESHLRPPLDSSNRSHRSSQSSWVIEVEPPSRSPSTTSRHTTATHAGFLSPDMSHMSLPTHAEPPTQPFIPPMNPPRSATQPFIPPVNAPVPPPGTVPVTATSASSGPVYHHLPAGFVPAPVGTLPPGFVPAPVGTLPPGFVPLSSTQSSGGYAPSQPPVTVSNATFSPPTLPPAEPFVPPRPPSLPRHIPPPRAPSVPAVQRVDPRYGGSVPPPPGSFEVEGRSRAMDPPHQAHQPGVPSYVYNPTRSGTGSTVLSGDTPPGQPAVIPPPSSHSRHSRPTMSRTNSGSNSIPVPIPGYLAKAASAGRRADSPSVSSGSGDEVSSDFGSLDTLTTPPERSARLYEEAPVPTNVSYPMRSGSAAGSATAATRVPPPPSRGGSRLAESSAGTHWSTPGRGPAPPSTAGWSPRTGSSPYGSYATFSTAPPTAERSGWGMGTPAPLNRPFSIFSDAPPPKGRPRDYDEEDDENEYADEPLTAASSTSNFSAMPLPVPPPGAMSRAPSGSAAVKERIERLGTILDSPVQSQGRTAPLAGSAAGSRAGTAASGSAKKKKGRRGVDLD